jgi:hypothetical protein
MEDLTLFKASIAHIWRASKKALCERGAHMPLAYMFDGSGKLICLGVIDQGADGEPVYPAVRTIIRNTGAKAFAMVSETWIGAPRPNESDDEAEQRMAGKLHLQPDRQEALLGVFIHQHLHLGKCWRFQRDAESKIVAGIGIDEDLPDTSMFGNLVNLLNQ